MKKVFSLILAGGLILGLSSCNQSATEDNHEVLATNTVSMSVEGMVCASGCAGKIEQTLNETEGIAMASVDFEAGTCVVEYDNAVISEEEIVKVVSEVNGGAYTVALMSNESASPVEANAGCAGGAKAGCGSKCSDQEKASCGSKASAAEKEACEQKCAKGGVTKEA